MVGVFAATDVTCSLFYVFFEAMLIPVLPDRPLRRTWT